MASFSFRQPTSASGVSPPPSPIISNPVSSTVGSNTSNTSKTSFIIFIIVIVVVLIIVGVLIYVVHMNKSSNKSHTSPSSPSPSSASPSSATLSSYMQTSQGGSCSDGTNNCMMKKSQFLVSLTQDVCNPGINCLSTDQSVLFVQSDGNMVVYAKPTASNPHPSPSVLWASNTNNVNATQNISAPYICRISHDGNLTLSGNGKDGSLVQYWQSGLPPQPHNTIQNAQLVLSATSLNLINDDSHSYWSSVPTPK